MAFSSLVVATFRKMMQAKGGGNLRVGLAAARDQVSPDDFDDIASELHKNDQTSWLLAPQQFPSSLEQLTANPRLTHSGLEREIRWVAAVLAQHAERLSQFCLHRSKFDEALVAGDYGEATVCLDRVENELGVSIWLISNRIAILQLRDGMTQQKAYLERLVNARNLDPIVIWLMCFVSVRVEDNVPYTLYLEELAPVLAREDVRDYVIHHLLPQESQRIAHIQNPIALEEAHPIIDRYQTFLSMAQLLLARDGFSRAPLLSQALRTLHAVRDPELDQLREIVEDTGIFEKNARAVLALHDLYTLGKYDEVIRCGKIAPELAARSRAMTEATSFDGGSLSDMTVSAMTDYLAVGDRYASAKAKLSKLSLLLSGQSLSTEIAAFLARDHDHIRVAKYSVLDRLAALRSRPGNPWNHELIESMPGRRQPLQHPLMNLYPDSIAIALRTTLRGSYQEALASLGSRGLPQHRVEFYLAHVARNSDDREHAIKHFRNSIRHDIPYVATRAQVYIFHALRESGRFQDAIEVVAQQCIRNPNAFRLYDLKEIIRAALQDESLRRDIRLCVLLHVAATSQDTELERQLSDVFDNVLLRYKLSRPSELTAAKIQELGIDQEYAIYFLRHVSVRRILDRQTEYEEPDDLDEERINICQLLVKMDPDRQLEYAAEIKSLVREAELFRLFRQVESSKIYVNIEGLHEFLSPELTESFARYQVLLGSPNLLRQAADIGKRAEQVVALQSLELPALEASSLFGDMLDRYARQFAYNPAFGLDAHISSGIRHGALEGRIRNPFLKHSLLELTKGDRPQIPAARRQSVEAVSQAVQQKIKQCLFTFAAELNKALLYAQAVVLRIRDESTGTGGAFDLYASDLEREGMRQLVLPDSSYELLLELFSKFCWGKVDVALNNVRRYLENDLSSMIVAALKPMIDLAAIYPEVQPVVQLKDSALLAQTELQHAISSVGLWFILPTNQTRDPFQTMAAAQVASMQVQKCYVDSAFKPKIVDDSKGKLAGRYLDDIVDIFFILLQNVIEHGDAPGCVTINISGDVRAIDIKVANPLGDEDSRLAAMRVAEEVMASYEQGTALDKAREEGGSGLSKVWRIMKHDLQCPPEVNVYVSARGDFVVAITLRGLEQ